MQSNSHIERDSRAGKYRRLYAMRWHGRDLDSVPLRIDQKRQRQPVRIATEKGDL